MTKKDLVSKKKILQELLDTLAEIEQGAPVPTACRRRNIDVVKFYHRLETINNIKGSNQRKSLNEMLSYVEKFYIDFYKETSIYGIDFPLDCKETVDYLFDLGTPGTDILREHYKNGLSYQNIALEKNVSRQAIHEASQVEMDRLRRNYSELMRIGITEWKAKEKAKEIYIEEQQEKALAYYKDKYKLHSVNDDLTVFSVGELDFSKRPRGVLMRLQIKTLDDLLSCPYSRISSARNIGVGSMKEILDKTADYCSAIGINYKSTPLFNVA